MLVLVLELELEEDTERASMQSSNKRLESRRTLSRSADQRRYVGMKFYFLFICP